jgi:protein-tyrosine-phosphatase
MAEGLLRTMADKAKISVGIRSAGVAAMNGSPISAHALDILQQKGMQGTLSSSSLSNRIVEGIDLVLTMTMVHKQKVIQRYPHLVDNTFTLKEFVEDNPQVLADIHERERLYADLQLKQVLSQPITAAERERLVELERNLPDYDIFDPFGGSFEDYLDCADEIERCLHKLLRRINPSS